MPPRPDMLHYSQIIDKKKIDLARKRKFESDKAKLLRNTQRIEASMNVGVVNTLLFSSNNSTALSNKDPNVFAHDVPGSDMPENDTEQMDWW